MVLFLFVTWEQRKLGEVTQYATSSLKIADCTDEGEFDLYDANSVIGKTNFNVQTEDYITIIKDGSGVGTVRLLPKNTSFIGTMGAILAKNSEIEFIYALLQRFDFSQHINGATIPHVYYSEYKQDIIYAPIRNEQRIIGKIFKQLDNLITLHQRKEFLSDCYSDIFNAEDKSKKVANAWEQRKLGDTIDFYSGLTYSPSDIVKDDGVFVLRSCNVQEGEIVDDDNVYVRAGAVNSDNVSVDDIIVVVRNGSRSLIGKHAKIKKNMPKTVIGAFMTGLRYKNSAYLNAVLNTSIFAREIEKDLGATINQITTGAFRKMVFPFPKQPEQSLIGNFFEQLDNLITLHQREHSVKKSTKLSKKHLGDKVLFANAWEQRKLREVFDYERPDTYIVKSDKYSDTYSTPVLTANKGFILGYTNEMQVCNKECIIFDDFTLDSKYVTFPFMVKSSALKILTAKIGYFLPFAYQLLQATNIEILGHARHYISVVQPTKVLIPSNDEQIRIGKCIQQIDNLITLHQRGLIKIQGDKNGKKRSFRRIVQRLF